MRKPSSAWKARSFLRELCNYWTLIPPSRLARRRFASPFRPWKLLTNVKQKNFKQLLHNFDCWMSFLRFVGKRRKEEAEREIRDGTTREQKKSLSNGKANKSSKGETMRILLIQLRQNCFHKLLSTILRAPLLTHPRQNEHHKEIVHEDTQIQSLLWLDFAMNSLHSMT